MDGTSLVEGRTYAFREKRVPGSELLEVKLIEKVGRGGKLKVRFHTGPHPGLEEYVSTRQLVVPWPEAQSFLQDEKRQAQVAEECRRTSERVLGQAASEVLGASGERAAALGHNGCLLMPEDELQRIMKRAGVAGRPQDPAPFGVPRPRRQRAPPLPSLGHSGSGVCRRRTREGPDGH
jgi:hypothetical protein